MKSIKPDILSRRQLFPLLGGAVALAAAPNLTSADPSDHRRGARFAPDSSLEQRRFELSVPP